MNVYKVICIENDGRKATRVGTCISKETCIRALSEYGVEVSSIKEVEPKENNAFEAIEMLHGDFSLNMCGYVAIYDMETKALYGVSEIIDRCLMDELKRRTFIHVRMTGMALTFSM